MKCCKNMEMLGLYWISIMLLTSTILITDAKAANEGAFECARRGLLGWTGNAKDASGCHKPGYPVPPGSSCPPHLTRRILHA